MTTAKLKDNAQRSAEDRRLIAGRYRTLDRIGHGRLGEIFAATDDGFEEAGVERHVAIQIIPESVVRNNRLFNQLDLGYSKLRASSHPNIVEFIRFGRYGKLGYLAMELLDGASLRRVLDGAEALPLDAVRPIIRGVGEALGFLHARDITHGNLTTRNVFITDNHEVRLLDVLPVDSAEVLVRGTVTSDRFGRCTVGDDVFGLACLAYEMLSGNHPFNCSSPAEARIAGLQAERIGSLPDREWQALHRALSFDEEQKMSLADFMREFGTQVTERIQPSIELPATERMQPAVEEAASECIQVSKEQAATQDETTLTAAPVAAPDPVPVIETGPSYARRVHKRNHPLRAVILGMLLAGVGAWSYFGQPEEDIANWISYLTSETEPDRTALTDRFVPVDQVADAAPEAIVPAAQHMPEALSSEPESAETDEESVSALDQPTDQSTPAAATKAEVLIAEFIVSVSEGDGAARIKKPRSEESDAPLYWWTKEHTATADEDFIPIAQRAVADASFDESDTLNIPLVNDSLFEPRESFFVNIGRLNAQEGQVERIATIRVDIIDDDLP